MSIINAPFSDGEMETGEVVIVIGEAGEVVVVALVKVELIAFILLSLAVVSSIILALLEIEVGKSNILLTSVVELGMPHWNVQVFKKTNPLWHNEQLHLHIYMNDEYLGIYKIYG